LNKACNKDDFPLERVDKIVDDSFVTFCFMRMAEGLKNAGCTFFRMIAIVLHPQLRRNILAYVDDIVVKSVHRRDHISDLAETFANLRAANLRLNPEKCVSAFTKGKFSGVWSQQKE
jgi:hypothetical protein